MALLQQTVLVDGQPQRAYFYPVFFRSGSFLEIEFLIIHSSGKIICDGDEYDINGVRNLIAARKLQTSIGEGDRLGVYDLATFKVVDVLCVVSEAELDKEIADLIKELNGKPTTSDACREAYERYLGEPSDANRLRLREAYELVPKHLRVWLLSFDEKDVPIRKAIEGRE